MKQRYAELDALRGIAALMVVLHHYTVRYGLNYVFFVPPVFSFELGRYGVQLFFIVSGFVIFLTLDKTVHAVDFIIARISRLFPAYWVAVILTFSVVSLFPLPGREVDIVSAITNLTMLQKWLEVKHVDGVYWTLAVELSFYVVMYLLFITKQIRRIELISFIWLGIIILSKYLEAQQFIHIHWRIKLMLLLEYGNLFIAGIMFYKLMHTNKVRHYLILLIALIVEYYLHGDLVFLIAIYFGLFLLFINGYLTTLAVKPLVFLGSISYSLYLIHQNIGYVVIQELEANDFAGPFSIIMVPLVLSISVASIMQKYIEKPSLIVIRRKWKQSSLREHFTNKGRE